MPGLRAARPALALRHLHARRRRPTVAAPRAAAQRAGAGAACARRPLPHGGPHPGRRPAGAAWPAAAAQPGAASTGLEAPPPLARSPATTTRAAAGPRRASRARCSTTRSRGGRRRRALGESAAGADRDDPPGLVACIHQPTAPRPRPPPHLKPPTHTHTAPPCPTSWFTVAERKRAQSLPDHVQLFGNVVEKGVQVGWGAWNSRGWKGGAPGACCAQPAAAATAACLLTASAWQLSSPLFPGPLGQVGNAVPWLLARAIAATVYEAATGRAPASQPPLLKGYNGCCATDPMPGVDLPVGAGQTTAGHVLTTGQQQQQWEQQTPPAAAQVLPRAVSPPHTLCNARPAHRQRQRELVSAMPAGIFAHAEAAAGGGDGRGSAGAECQHGQQQQQQHQAPQLGPPSRDPRRAHAAASSSQCPSTVPAGDGGEARRLVAQMVAGAFDKAVATADARVAAAAASKRRSGKRRGGSRGAGGHPAGSRRSVKRRRAAEPADAPPTPESACGLQACQQAAPPAEGEPV